MNIQEIREALFQMQDIPYREMQIKIIPSVKPEKIIGVRTPALRKMAREISAAGEGAAFLQDLPHRYFEENQLHAFIISGMKDYSSCMSSLEEFLPFVDNWATCDQMSPKVFRKHKGELLSHIRTWIASGRTYTIRFGIGMLMQHFLDEDFDISVADLEN
jgi:3-methyladenine DNA glycosylase AlkD